MRSIPVLVAGGGISGLSIARSLAEKGVNAEVWERAGQPGGKIRTRRQDGYTTERAASMVFNYQPAVSKFLGDTGLDRGIEECRAWPTRYIQYGGRLEAISMKLPAILKSPILSRRAKLRMLMEPFVPRGGGEGETISEFVSRRLGPEFLETFMEPLVGGTLASNPDRVEMEAVYPRLTAMERKFGSFGAAVLATRLGLKKPIGEAQLFSFRGGMSGLVEELAAHPAIDLRSGHRITAVEKVAHGWQVTGECDGVEQTVHASALIMSVPAPAAAGLVSEWDAKLAKLLRGIRYASIAVVHLGFNRSRIAHPLDGNGFLVPRSQGKAITGCLWMSSVFDGRAPAGKALLTNYISDVRVPDLAGWSDERAAAEALDTIRPALGIAGNPEMIRVDRHGHGLPLYYDAYHQRLKAIGARLGAHPGLFLEANYRGGVSVRDRLLRATLVSKQVAEFLRQRPSGDFAADSTGFETIVHSPKAALPANV